MRGWAKVIARRTGWKRRSSRSKGKQSDDGKTKWRETKRNGGFLSVQSCHCKSSK